MHLYYLDKPIENSNLSQVVGVQHYGDISLHKKTLKEKLKSSLPENWVFECIYDINDIRGDDVIVWCSNVVYLSQNKHEQFLAKLKSSCFPVIWGTLKGFVARSSSSNIIKIMSGDDVPDKVSLEYENHLLHISSSYTFKHYLQNKTHSRYFNEITLADGMHTKRSSKDDKLKAEYDFLSSVPSSLSEYFVKVFDYSTDDHGANYTMESIDANDTSIYFINNSLSETDLQTFFDIITRYFQESFKVGHVIKGNETSFIKEKNIERTTDLNSWIYSNDLNTFINNHTHFEDIDDAVATLNQKIAEYSNEINEAGSYFSHGDLCLSNILYHKDKQAIKLIDPRGGIDEETYRSPYYDLAKLAHSFLGGYDHIINNISQIEFDSNMRAYINMNIANQSLITSLFKKLVSDLNLNYKIVRIIEASLFLSMLPLHIDDKRKVFTLAVNGCNLLDQIDSN